MMLGNIEKVGKPLEKWNYERMMTWNTYRLTYQIDKHIGSLNI